MAAVPDESTLCEFNAFLKQRLSLKHFPFEPRKMRFVAPAIEAATSFSLVPLPPLAKGSKAPVAGRCARPAALKHAAPVIRVPNPRRRALHT
jgi:hypothetical protein